MTKEIHDALEAERRFRIVTYILSSRNTAANLRDFSIPRSTFYRWKAAHEKEGKAGLFRKKPIAKNYPGQISKEHVEKILELRSQYHLGPQRIVWYLERYHGFKTSCSSVCRTLKRNGIGSLPRNVGRRALHSQRYSKHVPGHHIQIDVKFLALVGKTGNKTRRYQYTAIDDATRIRALKIYQKHTQKSSIDFIDYVVEMFPFRIHTVRTDRGHEWQALFHLHVEGKGMQHVYIKPRSPQLNGKVERSHRTDQEKFYQLLKYTDDVDLNKKLAAWKEFYNFNRPHGAHGGQTPYESLRTMLG